MTPEVFGRLRALRDFYTAPIDEGVAHLLHLIYIRVQGYGVVIQTLKHIALDLAQRHDKPTLWFALHC